MRLIGTSLKESLEAVGIDEAVVTRWLGRPCGCRERAEKLNQLGLWLGRVVSGKLSGAREYLDRILDQEQE